VYNCPAAAAAAGSMITWSIETRVNDIENQCTI